MSKPKFEIDNDHEFKPKEKVLVIDKNEYDLWEGEISSIEGGVYKIHYPEFPDDDEELNDTSRLLVRTRKNLSIFRSQETKRQSADLESDDTTESSDSDDSDAEVSDDDDEGDYVPNAALKRKSSKKSKKNKKKTVSRTRPKGSRVSPRRSG
ncbi:Mitotic apparatus protein [Histomonas meleagridis]|uniref:Mitotic apparatus protein n=1 Tax=Histomonas meleagridis TaxID=135588 RepID=UPI00355A2E47|nr:Mitotic apparatus protein [Histomonas meleagridis]KAH0805979.1 Mitotic apparatus protein [Histomonas meleagridis]